MNALVFNDKEGVLDFFGGKTDIENKIIRAIGEPEKRFKEDARRILRAIRFSSTLGFKIEEETKKARHGKKYPENYRKLCSLGARLHNIKNGFIKKRKVTK